MFFSEQSWQKAGAMNVPQDRVMESIQLSSTSETGNPLATMVPVSEYRKVRIHPDHWYPVAWSRELKPGRALAVRFAGQPIVLIRPEKGAATSAVFALENRCAHRQVPLDAGVVSGCNIRCHYHGWTYDRNGACIDVPYLGKDKLPNGVRAFPCREEAGMILIFPGDAALAGEDNFPNLAAARNPAYKTRRFGREVGCHYSFMHENLMDMNHQFMHRKIMGQIRPRYLGRDLGDNWLEVRYTFARTAGAQPLGERAIFGGKRGKDVNDRDLMTIRTDYPYQTLSIVPHGATEPVFDLWICYTPLDLAQQTVRSFGFISVRRPANPLARAALSAAWPALVLFTEAIFREDRWIVEAEQRAHDHQGGNWNQEVFPVIRELGAQAARNGLAAGAGT
jgi:phenylpropionate dioxygenase-like ring-hydroxylating dioxygenase large terminal subunit